MSARWLGRLFPASVLVLTIGLTGSPAVTALPAARTMNTSAVAINEIDTATQTAFDFDIWRTTAGQVTADNVAYAVATCDGCTTAAVSIQIVLSGRGASSLRLDNQSVAVNLGCEDCSTTSVALQFVVAVDQKLGLTGAGRSNLAHIENELRGALAHDASQSAVMKATDKATTGIVNVLQTELRVKPVVKKHVDVAYGHR